MTPLGLRAMSCGSCAAAHLAPAEWVDQPCPACAEKAVEFMIPRNDPPPPERMLESKVDEGSLRAQLGEFVSATPWATADLKVDRLVHRARLVWLPAWLVDVDCAGDWQASVGFDEEVQSSREDFKGGVWVTTSVRETRKRWEPRQGTVRRHYDNLPSAAMSGQGRFQQALGEWEVHASSPWKTEALGAGAIRLPDRHQDDAWDDALAAMRKRVALDLREAAGGQGIRDVHTQAEAAAAEWTWLLMPVWCTWYADAEGEQQAVFVHGVTGKVAGPQMASVRRGRTTAAALAVVGMTCGGIGLAIGVVGIVVWPLLVAAMLMLCAAPLLCILALWPLLQPGRHNAGQEKLLLV